MVMSALELRVAVHNAQTAQFHLETNQLRTDVSALELRVTAHKAQIAHLQLETEQLEGLLDVKKKKLMETARFAVTKMPYEVMRRIFTLCSEPIFDQAEEFGQMQIKSWKHEDIMPLVVRNVCRDWWAIVEGTPALWSTLYLSLDDVPESVVRSGAMDEFIDTWVAKAGEHPLTLVLKAAGAGDDLQLFHLRRLIQRYAGRTKRLALDIRGCYLSGLGLEDLPLPMLTRASLLHGFDLLEEGEGEEEVTLFDAAPELFWLDIGRNSWWMDREVELPWELLTTFERTVKVVEFLMLAPNLRVAKVNLESEKGGATLTHRAMQNFSCTGDLSSLEWLRLPNGLSLDIGDDEFGVLPDYSESLKDFIRAATHLEGLRIPGAARLTFSRVEASATPMESLVNFLEEHRDQIQSLRLRWRRLGVMSQCESVLRDAVDAQFERLGRGVMQDNWSLDQCGLGQGWAQ
ncbi:hypothetical protein C8R46DRAFT_1037142 [Mycena filopes]|nr:hypothetical protein C8R46DRAFT_1037142 [Mycena filopes]